jgi:CheY-like chemotaxis protein
MSRRDFQILYVDADAQQARLAAELMRGGRRHVLHMSNGADVLAYLRGQLPHANRRRPDLILLDFNLPDRAGRAILTQLKSDEMLRQIPVVVMGSSRNREDVLRAYDAFANCYVAKPTTQEEFKRVLHTLQEFWFGVAKLPQA